MTHKIFDSMSKPFCREGYEASFKTRSNSFCNYHAVSATKKTEYRTASTILTLVMLISLCCHLPSANCSKDVKISQNSVKALFSSESSPAEKSPKTPSRAKLDTREPSSRSKLLNPRESSQNENHKELYTEKTSELTTKEHPKSEANKSRQAVTKLKSQEALEVKRGSPSEAKTMPDKREKQKQHKLAGKDKDFTARSQQSLPSEVLEEKEFCQPKSFVHYNVTFIPIWSSKRFPKMYPTYRPNAQWSKVIGKFFFYVRFK